MTRETRIGLLVGLGFIVMFGLVLTELTGTGRPTPPPASLSEAAVVSVASSDVSPVVIEPRVLSPRIGPAVATANPQEPAAPARVTLAAELSPVEPVAVAPAAGIPEVVASVPVSPAPVVEEHQPAPAVRTYTVQEGDSLSAIACKMYGPGRQREYRRIYEANRDKLSSPELIAVGQVLVIPELEGATSPSRPGAPSPAATTLARAGVQEMDLDELAEALGVATSNSPGRAGSPPIEVTRQARAGGRVVYVVRRGDTLVKIARKTLHDDSRAAVMSIFQANKGKLSHPDRLPVGVTLVIPS